MIDKVLYAKLVFPVENVKKLAILCEGVHVVGLEEVESPHLELLRTTISALKPYKEKYAKHVSELSNPEIKEICDTALGREEHINRLLSDIPDLKSHIKELYPWGNLLKYTKLRERGYFVKFCINPKKETPELPCTVISIGNRMTLISKKEDIDIPESLVEIQINGEIEIYNQEMDRLNKELGELKSKMSEDAKALNALKKAEELMVYNLNLKAFEAVIKDNGTLCEIEVYFPSSEKEKYLELFDGYAGLYIRTPNEDENIPVVLKNQWLGSLFEILTKQGSVPKYNVDIDPTPFLMIPFWAYFGLCMPDIGYSILILGGVFGAKHTLKKRNISVSDAVQRLIDVVTVLGVGSFISGVLASSLFGYTLPYPAVLTTENIMGVGMWLGVAQLIFGILLKVFVSWHGRTEWKIGADVGWLMAYVGVVMWFIGLDPKNLISYGGMAAVFLEGFEPYREKFSIKNTGIYIGNWIGSSLWNSFNRASGLFSDTISFVRIPVLFLVAIVLGNVVVALGGSIGGVFGVFIIIFGNLFVFFLSILGAIAHPARLQLIEFRHQFETGDEKASFYKPFNQ